MPLRLESVLIENGDGPGPYGSKGAGEGGMLAVAAAIGAAVNEAAGVTIRDLPLTPERIWKSPQRKTQNEKRIEIAPVYAGSILFQPDVAEFNLHRLAAVRASGSR